MSLSDSMFLFEIIIKEIESFFEYKDHSILSQFGDVFQLYLKNPHEFESSLPKPPKKKKKSKIRVSNSKNTKTSMDSKALIGQSVLIVSNSESLKDKMRQYPLEVTFRSKYNADIILASNQIPWCETFIDYLSGVNNKQSMDPVTVDGKYSIFHEYTSKRMATIKLVVKLSYIKDKLNTQFRSLSEENPRTFMYTGFNSSPTTILSIMEEEKERYLRDETGIIKTIYPAGKTKFKRSSGAPLIIKTSGMLRTDSKLEDKEDATHIDCLRNNIRNNVVSFVKSESSIDIQKKQSLVKSQSYYSLNNLNTLNYIFGESRGPFGNQVYCVGYFTVQNDFAKDPVSPKESVNSSKSSEKSDDVVRKKYQFSLCDDECPGKRPCEYGRPSSCSLDLPKEAAHLITVKKCDRVDCSSAKVREPPSPPDDRLMVDLSSLRPQTCDKTEIVEQVVGGMTAKMQMGPHPCYCSCECTFGFTKKTTYCNICGGVEKFGEEKLGPLAFPCPIYHKLVDKSRKTVSSGSDTKKKKNASGDKNGESGKDNKKGKKKKKDDRFKFNYGYKGIPPQIGHSQCAMPCTGTLGAVPKNMGWLWTAENVPGMRIANGWKPGAISKRLLRKLNKLTRQTYAVESRKPLKKSKKRTENKPMLIVCKVNGEYVIEMQTSPENNEGGNDQYTPLVYKIAKASNKDKLAKLELKKRRLVKELVGNFKDPYHPDICEKTCLKAYKAAVGLAPDDTNNTECTCEDIEQMESSESCYCDYDDVSSDCSSLDVDWEIHFSPPIASHS